MTLETDPKRVKELAAEREEENWRFRRFLKNIDLSVKQLDAIVHRHLRTVSDQIDCLACGNCCRETSPILSRRDIRRLASGIGLSPREVIDRYLQPDEKDDFFAFTDEPCPFLSENTCTVYDSRPEDCRSFPHLHKQEFVHRLIQAVDNCSVCPIVYNVFERLKAELWNETDACEDEWEWSGPGTA